MKLRILTLFALAALISCFPICASELGEPLGPEDWIFEQPGMWADYPNSRNASYSNDLTPLHDGSQFRILDPSVHHRDQQIVDAAGRILHIERTGDAGTCGTEGLAEYRLVAFTPLSGTQTLARLQERCVDPLGPVIDRVAQPLSDDQGMGLYDPLAGTLLVRSNNIQETRGTPDYPQHTLITRIGGLPNYFDVLTTFTPDTTQLTWSSPFMPMGLPARAADSFDVYRGDLRALNAHGPAAFSAMEPVACDVGSEDVPEVGRRHVVPLPPLASDREFYLVAAKAGGEVRYGRWQLESAGDVKGRSGAVMPPCPAASTRE